MKKITKIALIACSAIVLYSCDNEDGTGYSTTHANEDVTGFVANNAVETITEGESFPLVINIDKPQPVDIHVKVKLVSATADPDHDFEYPHEIIIPAYATSGQALVKTTDDCDYETPTDFTLEIGDNTTSNAAIPVKTVKFNILNKVGTDLEIEFDYDKAYVDGSTATTLYDEGYDVDYYILDSNGDDIGNYEAATGDMPETLALSAGELPDGEYQIWQDLWEDAGVPLAVTTPFTIPTHVNYYKCGSEQLNGTFTQESGFELNSTDIEHNPWNYVVTIVVNGGTYTLKNSGGSTIATGRSLAKIHASLLQARLNNPNRR
ncbi:MAG: hypothetical protein V4670_11430 [Bacteroidota bacterium]